MKPYLKRGSWNSVCDVCGFVFKAEQLLLRWDGLRVCSHDFEYRHPQDLIRIPVDTPSVSWTRPDPPTTGYYACTYQGASAVAGLAVAGCMRAGVSLT